VEWEKSTEVRTEGHKLKGVNNESPITRSDNLVQNHQEQTNIGPDTDIELGIDQLGIDQLGID
jgi:hypothetical protein